MRKARKSSRIKEILWPHISSIIKTKRIDAGISRNSLGRVLGYTSSANSGRATIIQWEEKGCIPSLSTFYLLAAIFNCPLDDFFPPKEHVIEKSQFKIGAKPKEYVPFINEASQ
jgi:transcriptional regulator with XRE-family HTH domain